MDLSLSKSMNDEEDDLLADSDNNDENDDDSSSEGDSPQGKDKFQSQRLNAVSFFDNDDNDSSESEEDDDGDMEVDEDLLLLELTAVNDKLAAEPYSYDLYLEKIRILKSLGDLDQLRNVREKMSKLYPLSPSLWIDWIKDEQKLVSNNEEKDRVISLMDRAVKDYSSVEVWLEYINFCLSNMKEEDGVRKCRDVFERALGSCGLHVSMGSLIWDTYRDFEGALLGTKTSTDEITEQEKIYANLCKRQLAVPLLDMHNRYEQIKSKIGMDANTEVSFKKAFERLKDLETWEAKLIQASEDVQKVQVYKDYIDDEKKAKSNPARIQCLYERTITESPLDVSVWTDYIDYLSKNLKVSELVLDVAERASRNCPWILSVWTKYMWTVETFVEDDEKKFENMKTVFENAIVYCGTADQAGTLWLKYLEFLRRRINYTDPGDKQLIVLRKTFSAAEKHLLQHVQEPNDYISQILQFHARFEATLAKSITADVRIIWKDIFSRGYGQNFRIWSNYITQMLKFGEEPKWIRNELSKAMSHVQDDKQSAADLWLNYERDYGDLKSLTSAEEKISKELEKMIMNSNSDNYNQFQYDYNEKSSRQYDQRGNTKGRKRRFDEPINFVPAKKGKVSGTSNDVVDGEVQANNFKMPAIPKAKTSNTEKNLKTKEIKDAPAPVKHDSSKDSRTVFVSNLNFVTAEDAIKLFFEICGPVEEVRLVKDFKGKSKGFGYILFVNEDSVKVALDKDRQPLEGRPVFISKCDPDKSTRKVQFKYQAALETHKIFVKGIPFSMTVEDLKKMFDPFGEIKDCRLVTHRNGYSKGMAYVEFENAASASSAILKTDETTIDGHTISVAISNPPIKNRSLQFKPPPPSTPTQEPGLRRSRNVFVPRAVQVLSTTVTSEKPKLSSEIKSTPKSNEEFRKMFMKK